MYPNRFQMENKCEFLNWRITAEINYVPLLFDLLQVPYLWFPQKWYSVRLYHQLLVGGLMYYCGVFFCVCMFAHSDFQHDVAHLFGFLCFVFCFVCLWVPSVVRFSGLSIIGCLFGFLWSLLTNCNELSPLTHRALYVRYTRFYYTSPGIVLFTKWN